MTQRDYHQILFESKSSKGDSGIFTIRGNLDGEEAEDFSEREQFIGLMIGRDEFLLPISTVNEIVMLKPITFVPNTSKVIEGVFNLRGTIIPAVNLRRMMGMPRGDAGPSARIVIVKNTDIIPGQRIIVGLLVDGITFVASLLPSQIERQILSGKGAGAELISCISKVDSKITGILDVTKIIQSAAGRELGHDDVDVFAKSRSAS